MTREERREKWENYWYHYKWHTILAIFVTVCALYTVFDYTTRQSSDFDLTYIGDYMNYEGLSEALVANYPDIITDANGDGKIKVEVNAIYTSENIAYDSDLNFWQRIDIDLVNGESYIYLVDEHLLDAFIKRGANGVIKTADGYVNHIDVSENKFLKEFLPKDRKVFMCVRKYFADGADEKTNLLEERSLKLIEKILENN